MGFLRQGVLGLALFALVSASGAPAYPAEAIQGPFALNKWVKISQLVCDRAGNHCYVSAGADPISGCGQWSVLIIDISDSFGKMLYSMAMTAIAADKTVTFNYQIRPGNSCYVTAVAMANF